MMFVRFLNVYNNCKSGLELIISRRISRSNLKRRSGDTTVQVILALVETINVTGGDSECALAAAEGSPTRDLPGLGWNRGHSFTNHFAIHKKDTC